MILLENVQSPVTGEARVGTPLGDRVECGVMSRCVAGNPVTHQELDGWTLSGNGFPMSEAYGLPLNAKSLVGSVMANLCDSHYPLHMAMVEVSSQRVSIDKAFSVPKCV